MIIAHEFIGLPVETAPVLIVWGHGWGQDRKAFASCAESLKTVAAHLLLDFPGFGQSPVPSEVWGTAEYADAVAELIRPYRRSGRKIIWAGISFGGRVGIQLAARHPDVIDGLFLVAAFGLPRRRSLLEKIALKSRIYAFKTMKHLAPLFGMSLDELRKKYGSPDYRNAGPLRPIFLKVVGENLTEQARQIKCPTALVYGANDTETPPDIGERYATLIPDARLSILPGHDHYSVLGPAQHLLVKRMSELMERVS